MSNMENTSKNTARKTNLLRGARQRNCLMIVPCLVWVYLIQAKGDIEMKDRLDACKEKPNCVSSMDTRDNYMVSPFTYSGDSKVLTSRLIKIIQEMPRTSIVVSSPNYLHVEFKSAIFRFIDDVEFLLDDEKKLLHMRSSSRTGYSDFGVNRKRLNAIVQKLKSGDNL